MRSRWWTATGVAVVVASGSVAAALFDASATVSQPADRATRPPRSFSLIATGDWLSEARVNAAAAGFATPPARFDNAALLAPIAAIIASADLAICHIELPITEPGGRYGRVGTAPSGFATLASPYELAADMRRAGYDRCTTASNHSNDLGVGGIDSTLAALDAAGLTHTGTARTPAEADVDIVDVNHVRVAHLSYTATSNTGFPSYSWRVNRASAGAIAQATAQARAAGAEVVILSLHVFNEMGTAPHPDDRALTTQIVQASDLDLVIMHGPHVVQPFEHVAGTPVFWSLGNLASGMGVAGRGRFSDPRTLDGLLAAVRFTERSDGSFAISTDSVLLCQMTDTRVVYAGLTALNDATAPPDARAGIGECIDRSAPVVTNLR